MVGCWVAVVCPQHHAAEGMQMSVGTVSPSLSKYRRVHIYGRTRAKIGIHILERGLCMHGQLKFVIVRVIKLEFWWHMRLIDRLSHNFSPNSTHLMLRLRSLFAVLLPLSIVPHNAWHVVPSNLRLPIPKFTR